MRQIEKLLSGGDLRSIGKRNSVVLKIKNQNDFDELFQFLFHKDRIFAMRAADAIEKITIKNPVYLAKHKKKILELCNTADDRELQWHLALMIPRLHLTYKELKRIWNILSRWASDNTESRIVRVNSIQGLFELSRVYTKLITDFNMILSNIERQNIPSITARIKKLRKSSGRINP
ncbi:MAG: hypothetical protein ABSB78_06365 [Bacteroidota bacterium]